MRSREVDNERRQHLDYPPVVLVRSTRGGWLSSVVGKATGHGNRRRGRTLYYASGRFAAAAGAAGKTDTAGETDNKSPDTGIPPHPADGGRLAWVAEDDCNRRGLWSADEISSRQRIPRDHILGP